jgi:Ferritin-like domain
VPRTRVDVLKLGAVGVGAAVLGRSLVGPAFASQSAPSAEQDRKILNFALVLERLQASFYRAGLERGSLTGELRQFAEVVGANEQDHVAFLEHALGAHARPAPRFNLAAAAGGERRFANTARMLEDAGVAAYNGQAANLTRSVLGPATEIVSVEARHAAWIRDILGLPPAPHAADAGASSAAIVAQLRSSGLLT